MIKEIRDNLELIITSPFANVLNSQSKDGFNLFVRNQHGQKLATIFIPAGNEGLDEIRQLILDIRANYRQHCINALAKLSQSFNQPHFMFKVDTGDGRVLISDHGELSQYANIYEFNWLYGTV